MSLLRPFQALRPVSKQVRDVAAPPYDVVSRDEAYHFAKDNPLSFLHVSRAEIDLTPETNPYADDVYQEASKNFKRLIEGGYLQKDNEETLYLYELKMGEQTQVGIVGTYSLKEYESGQLKKHEKTRVIKEDDRSRHILALGSQTGPVFLTYRGVRQIDTLVSEICRDPASSPLYQFTSPSGVTHTVWKVHQPDSETLIQLFSSQVCDLYIADGHHRAAAASRAQKTQMNCNPHHTGQESYNFLLAVAFPDWQLKILPYHRVIRDLNGLSVEQFFEQVERYFRIEAKTGIEQLPIRGQFKFYMGHKWYGAVPLNQMSMEQLDVEVLQDLLLTPILKISEPRIDPRIDFVGGIRGLSELMRLVDSGEFTLAIAVHATDLSDVLKTADQGGIMPPKSTWFEPKLCDGLFCHMINGN